MRIISILAGTLLALSTAVPPARASDPALLVTLGEVTDTSAVLWARAPAAGRVAAQYAPRAGEGSATPRLVEASAEPARDRTVKLRLEALRPGTRYRYTVSQGALAVDGEFVSAPAPGSAAPVRLSWSGDLGSRGHCRHVTAGYPIFHALAQHRPDFFLFVGDTVYADQVCAGADRKPGSDFRASSLEEFWAKHRYNRADPGVQAFFRQTAVHAIWDDHDVRNDFAGPSEPLMPVGRQAFLDYFPIVPPAEEPGRLYRSFRWGGVLEVFILDTRQYRSRNTDVDGPGKTMLGAEQKRWLLDAVAGSSAIWKVVVTSVSLSVPTGRPARDSWTSANFLGFPEPGAGFSVERDAVLEAFRSAGIRNLVFLSADAHHAEILRHQPTETWSFHEFVAGPLAAFYGLSRPVDQGLNPQTLFALGGIENFGTIDMDAGSLTVRIIDVNGTVRFLHTIQRSP
jgi:alkaline phosphatase D